MCISVDFPEPDGPIMARNSPGAIVNEAFRKAWTSEVPIK